MPDGKDLLRSAVYRNAYENNEQVRESAAAHQKMQEEAAKAQAEQVEQRRAEVQKHLEKLRAERQGGTPQSAAAQDVPPQDLTQKKLEEKDPLKAVEEAERVARREEEVALDIYDKFLDSPMSGGQSDPAEEAAGIRADRAGEVAKAWNEVKESIKETRDVAAEVAAFEGSQGDQVPFSTWEEVRASPDIAKTYMNARRLHEEYQRDFGVQQPVVAAPESVVQAARASRSLTSERTSESTSEQLAKNPAKKPASPVAAPAKAPGRGASH